MFIDIHLKLYEIKIILLFIVSKMSGESKFSSKDEEIQYWKSLADEYLQE